jgi:hypothetical protein
MAKRVVEVMFTTGCPYVGLAIQRVRLAAAHKGAEIDLEIRLVRVESLRDAARRRFRGSPTVRVDGRDVEPAERSGIFGLHGRAYLTEGGVDRAPPVTWIQRALGVPSGKRRHFRSSGTHDAVADEPTSRRGSTGSYDPTMGGRGSGRWRRFG